MSRTFFLISSIICLLILGACFILPFSHQVEVDILEQRSYGHLGTINSIFIGADFYRLIFMVMVPILLMALIHIIKRNTLTAVLVIFVALGALIFTWLLSTSLFYESEYSKATRLFGFDVLLGTVVLFLIISCFNLLRVIKERKPGFQQELRKD